MYDYFLNQHGERMRNNITLSVLFLICFSSFSTDLYGQTVEQKLKECSEIDVSLIRLQCYDRLTENQSVQNAKPSGERNGLLSRITRSNNDNDSAKDEIDNGSDENNEASETKDIFGLIIEDKRDSIQSRIKGEFKGWDGYTKFLLENGQVWQQSSYGILRVKMNSPSIIIKRSRMSDTYTLKIEGLNSSVKVKRIK